MDAFWKDLKSGFRQLAHKPTLPILAIVTLSLGIGANTAVFSIVHGILLQPLPFTEPGELVQIWEAHPRGGNMSVASLNAADWRVWGPDGAAAMLGIKPSTLSYRMNAFGIEKSP